MNFEALLLRGLFNVQLIKSSLYNGEISERLPLKASTKPLKFKFKEEEQTLTYNKLPHANGMDNIKITCTHKKPGSQYNIPLSIPNIKKSSVFFTVVYFSRRFGQSM